MKALRNITADLLYQFRISGGLFWRLTCVSAYYAVYEINRLLGRAQDTSRLRALALLGRWGSLSRTVDLRLPEGITLTMDLMSAAFMPREFLSDKMYEELPQFVPRAGQTVVDVGAHQGFFSTRAAKTVGPSGRVVCVEPAPFNRGLLTRNLSANGLSNAAVFAGAAADFDGEMELFLSPLVTGGSSLLIRTEPQNVAERTAVKTPVKRLDRILEDAGVGKVDLIKIDVEGACLVVLAGAPKTLASKPRLVMEVEGGEDDVRPVTAKLEAAGYRCVRKDSIVYAEPV